MKVLLRFVLLAALGTTVVSCHSSATKKPKKTPPAATKKEAKIDPRKEATDVDFDAFVGRLRKAVSMHDMNTIASMMTPNFGYQLDPPLEGDGVFQFWDERNIWPELEGVLSEKFVKSSDTDFMVAPPQFADASLGYQGYRAGIRRINGSWKFAYFVTGGAKE